MAGGWASLGLMPELVDAAENDFDWILPTGVQDECIPLILGGGDVMASAETGSGKTAAFALPTLQISHEEMTAAGSTRRKVAGKKESAGKSHPRILQFQMSVYDRDKNISIDSNSGGLLLQSRDINEWSGCRCDAGVASGGKWYFECTIRDEGIVRVGLSTKFASLDLGADEGGYGYGGTGMKVHRGKFEPYFIESDATKGKVSFGKNDVIGCLVNLLGENSSVSFSKNGIMIGKAFDIDLHESTKKDCQQYALFPTVSLKNAECELNFGRHGMNSFCFPPPSEEKYLPIASATTLSGKVENPQTPGSDSSLDYYGKREGPLAIVIEPTRDLAQQTYRVFSDFARRLSDPGIEAALLVGGINPQRVLRQLQRNNVHVVVGTPPIVMSYIKQGKIKTSRCCMFILDEADQLVNRDNLPYIENIFSRLRKGGQFRSVFDRLQVCFFSATLHSAEVRKLTAKICHRPLWVDLKGRNDSIVPDTVHNCVVHVDPESNKGVRHCESTVQTDAVHRQGDLDAEVSLGNLSDEERKSEQIKLLKPVIMLQLLETFQMDQVLIFCRTNLDCDLLETFLRKVGGKAITDRDTYSCRVLAGMRPMQERQESLKAFKEGEARILIATDVAARGLDIRELPFVINMTLPDEPQTYVHRIGRVGRAERIGLAISIVSTVKEKVWYCQSGKKPPCEDTRMYEKGGEFFCIKLNSNISLCTEQVTFESIVVLLFAFNSLFQAIVSGIVSLNF
mmetsp:Transcript_60576/g.179558  ORF Transcript_60576/g.179558 Transcript_60576/m.179558 type:complete len:737 (-) Transcript_60576:353-2563(-)